MVHVAIENAGYFLFGAAYVGTPLLLLAGLNELALRTLTRRR